MDGIPDGLADFLETAGWVPGRKIPIDSLVATLRSVGFPVVDPAIEFLSQFGLLRFDHEPSITINDEKIWCWTTFDPTMVATPRDARIAGRCSNVVGRELSPVGLDGFHLTIYLADNRNFYAGRDASVFKYANSTCGLFEAMRDGIRPVRIGEWKLE